MILNFATKVYFFIDVFLLPFQVMDDYSDEINKNILEDLKQSTRNLTEAEEVVDLANRKLGTYHIISFIIYSYVYMCRIKCMLFFN